MINGRRDRIRGEINRGKTLIRVHRSLDYVRDTICTYVYVTSVRMYTHTHDTERVMYANLHNLSRCRVVSTTLWSLWAHNSEPLKPLKRFNHWRVAHFFSPPTKSCLLPHRHCCCATKSCLLEKRKKKSDKPRPIEIYFYFINILLSTGRILRGF